MTHRRISLDDDPQLVLGVSLEAGDAQIRAAYLAKVKEFPPDRSPEQFERIRDAYEALRDIKRRTRMMLLSVDPVVPLAALLEGKEKKDRRFVGPDPWLAVMKQK